MQTLPFFTYPKNRLFTYKVAYDGGTAPNPFGKVCTLAICKPKIRSVAIHGDVIAGFGTGSESNRLVYVMAVNESPRWEGYINLCHKQWPDKIPKTDKDFGDCIYEFEAGKEGSIAQTPIPNGTGHGVGDFPKDVQSGRKVLIGPTFWYFGGGAKYRFELPEDLQGLVPVKQGHRSNANRELASKFFDWFNELIHLHRLPCGVHGRPQLLSSDVEIPIGSVTKSRC